MPLPSPRLIFTLWLAPALLLSSCTSNSESPAQVPAPTPAARATTVRPLTRATPVPSPSLGQLQTTVICFDRINFPEDDEGLRTQIGPALGIIALSVEPNDTMTVTFDPEVTSRDLIVSLARGLGFSARDAPCGP